MLSSSINHKTAVNSMCKFSFCSRNLALVIWDLGRSGRRQLQWVPQTGWMKQTHLAVLILPLSFQVLHGIKLQFRHRRASQRYRFMCCEIDYMPRLMLHLFASAVGIEPFGLKIQFERFREVTVFIDFVFHVHCSEAQSWMCLDLFPPVLCHSLLTGE